MSKVSFNYTALTNDKVRKQARDAATEIRAMLQVTGQHVVEIGNRLTAIKKALGPRAFGEWLKAEFEWTESVAQNHMLCARRFDGLDCLHQFQPYALYQLCRQATPDAAIKAAIKLAGSGELVTGRKANDLIAKHGGKLLRPPKGQQTSKGHGATAAGTSAAGTPATGSTTAGKSSASNTAGGVETLQTTLDEFAANLDTVARKLSRADRESLADRFLQLALQLRSVTTPKTGKAGGRKTGGRKTTRRSRSSGAAA